MAHRFLDFELDEDLFELRSRGEVIPIQGRVFAMIAYLLHARDRVVGKDELTRALWKGTVVSEATISQVVMLARKALRDEGESQRVIKTVRGRGFRFVAPVKTGAGTDAEVQALPQTAAIAAPPASLLGRERELGLLGERLARAESGQGGLVLIGGEPGIGKTTLAEALAAQALERGVEVIWGRAWEGGGAPPFWPWIQVLRAMTERDDAEPLRRFSALSAVELAPLLAELGEDAGQAAQAPSGPPHHEELDGLRARFRQFDATARLLRYAGSASGDAAGEPRRTRLIILDDLHAADEASIQLTRFVMPELRELHLLIVGTYRDLERTSAPALAPLVESCAENALQLRGLGPSEVGELVARRIGSAAPLRWANALHRLSGGNPLLVGELCARLEVNATDPLLELSQLADFPLPERVAGAVRKHLAELPASARAVLSTASALGREFSPPLIAALHACSESQLLETLSPALRQGVVRPAAHSAGRLIFSHGLVCNAVYAELAPQLRLELHRKIAELLERTAPPGRLPLHEIAHHFFLAAADGCRDRAIEYARLAAAQAFSMMAYETAAELYDRALSLAELEQVDGALWHELACNAGDAWYQSGELERAVARYARAAELARGEAQPERFAWAVIKSAYAVRGTLLHDRSRQGQLRDALARLPPGDSEIKALALCGSALALRSADPLGERQALTRDAVAMARRLGNLQILQMTLNASHFALWGAVPPQELLPIATEIVELARANQDHELLLDARLWRMADASELGQWPAALHDHREYQAEAERHGSPWHRHMALGASALEASANGEFARARELSERALALGLRIQEPLAEGFHALRLLFLDLQQGSLSGPSAAPPQQPPAFVPEEYRAFWALAWASSGHADAARELLTEVMTKAREQLLSIQLRKPTLAAMARVCVTLGDGATAQELYDLLSPSAGLLLFLQAWVLLGPVDYYLGLLAASMGNRPAAAEHFERALPQAVQTRPWLLQTQCAFGQLLAADRGSRTRARGLLRAAEEGARQLGMLGLQEQARRACERL